MRTREEIEEGLERLREHLLPMSDRPSTAVKFNEAYNQVTLEVLLDIRELLEQAELEE